MSEQKISFSAKTYYSFVYICTIISMYPYLFFILYNNDTTAYKCSELLKVVYFYGKQVYNFNE